jgi:hypothetical protein
MEKKQVVDFWLRVIRISLVAGICFRSFHVALAVYLVISGVYILVLFCDPGPTKEDTVLEKIFFPLIGVMISGFLLISAGQYLGLETVLPNFTPLSIVILFSLGAFVYIGAMIADSITAIFRRHHCIK